MPCASQCEVASMQHRIVVERRDPSPTVLASGHVDPSSNANWETYINRWAKISSRGGVESWKFKTVRAEVSHLIEVRSDAATRAISPTMRVKFGTRYMQIESVVDVDEARRTVQLQCVEQVT